MMFRTKLILLALMANLLAGGLAYQLFISSQTIKTQMQLFLPLTTELEGISKIHSALTRQRKEILDYLSSQDAFDKEEFVSISLELEKNFSLWKNSSIQQQRLGVKKEAQDLKLILQTHSVYQDWLKSLTELSTLAEESDRQLAQQEFLLLEKNVFKQKLIPSLKEALHDGTFEVEETYHGLLLAVGATPWGTSTHSRQLETIHAGMEFMIGGNQANASVNDQFSYLVEYLLFGQEKTLLAYEHSLVLSLDALAIWSHAAEELAEREENPAEGSLALVTAVDASFERFTQQARKAIELKKAANTSAALELILEQGDTLIADFHQGTSQAIAQAAQSLVARASFQSTTGFVLLFLFLLTSSLLSVRMVWDMLRSVNSIGAGMDAIREGDLGHRILMGKDDFIGNLAQTFNRMMDSLCQTQTELKQLTRELEERVEERTAELATTNRDLEAFNSMVSHDLNTPLTIMYGYSEFLLAEQGENGSAKNLAVAENIMMACYDMSRIVSTLESLSRASHKQLTRQPVLLGKLVEQNIEQLSTTEPERKVELVVNPAPEADGDPSLLEIIITNLVGNAWKYTGKTAAAKIEFGTLERDGKPVWYIRDNGVGFDMSKSDQLFKTFSRLHPKKDFKGTGIGLSTVQRIIHRHGGEIWAESTVDQGATFYFSLEPVDSKSSQTQQPV